jgi:hypothetical protein
MQLSPLWCSFPAEAMRGILAFPISYSQPLEYGVRLPTWGVSIAGWMKFDTPKP